MKELVEILRLWEMKRHEPLALATLVRSKGSSFRRVGARMLICQDGAIAGSLSGGCLEEEVAARAQAVAQTGAPALMEFDTRARFGCNGSIEVFVEKLNDDFLAGVTAAMRARRSCRAVTIFQATEADHGSRLIAPTQAAPEGAFLQTITPPIRLIIFGGGHDSRPLRALADLLGWSAIEVEQAADLPPAADNRTAAVVKSHNYGRDCAALRHLLQLGLRYIGLMGPRARRDQLLGDLLDSGVQISQEIFAPAGLDLGSEGPEEIALAIVAEIQTVFAEASGESLRARKAPIHGWNVTPAEACKASAQ